MDSNVHIAYLLFGGNLGPVATNFRQAERLLTKRLKVKRRSKLYRTEAWGMENAPDFLNQVLEVETVLAPEPLLQLLLETEQCLGRDREADAEGRYQSRALDIDILFYDDLVMKKSELQIPHPRLPERKFALVPLAELAGAKLHPELGKSVLQLIEDLEDESEVQVYD